MTKPTPEEKCLPFCQCNKCCQDLSSPSPEARVDWEKEAMDILDGLYLDAVKDSHPHHLPVPCIGGIKECAKAIANLCKAAFEKGRETR